MTCEQCDKVCKRRGVAMSPHHRSLCDTSQAYADIFDRKYGVTDSTVVPLSLQPDADQEWETVPGDKSAIGTRLHEIITRETGADIDCPACRAAIIRINQQSPAEVTASRDTIVANIVRRAETKSPKLWQRLAVKVDGIIGTGQTAKRVGSWLDEAIATGAEPQKQAARSVPRKKKEKRRHGNRIARGAGRNSRTVRAKRRRAFVALPYGGEVRRNLIYHLFPLSANEELWRWHVEQLRQRVEVFNGRRIIAIADDRSTSSVAEVRAAFGDGFEFLVVKNAPQRGEQATFSRLLKSVMTDDARDVTFYAHAKGMSYLPPDGRCVRKGGHTHKPGIVKHWSAQMYQACLDRVDLVDDALRSHAVCGAFRKDTRLDSAAWYYSGAFFWMRNAHVSQVDWQDVSSRRWASESWPGTHFTAAESVTLCGDGVGSLYRAADWDKLDGQVDEMIARPSPPARVEVVTNPPAVTIITPTGDRPFAFGLCEQWVERQTFAGAVQWIVIDDGVIPTTVTAGQDYIRIKPHRSDPDHTLARNLRAAIPQIRGDRVVVIEDDDWYSAGYLDAMVERLKSHTMVGMGQARYYWPRVAKYREFPEHVHASLCRTGIRREAMGAMAAAYSTDALEADMRLWRAGGFIDPDNRWSVSMKQMPGREGGGGSPDSGTHDFDLSILRHWIGDDVEAYRNILPKLPVELHFGAPVVVYTVQLGGYDTIRAPTVISDLVRYVAITDGEAPAPWEVSRRKTPGKNCARESRRLKMLSHNLFPDAAWTIYIDAQLQMMVDPLELIAECQAWCGERDLYVFDHHERTCLYTEAAECVRIRKARKQDVGPQIARYRAAGFPKGAGLYLGGMLIRRNSNCSVFNATWWDEVRRGSHRDQISLPVAIKRSGVNFGSLPVLWWQHLFLRHDHNRNGHRRCVGFAPTKKSTRHA